VIEDLHPLLVRHRVEPFHKIAMPYAGIPGKGSAFRAIFELADHFGARACAVVDSDLRSITPEWMELLLKPVLNEGFDFVAPQYHRHKYASPSGAISAFRDGWPGSISARMSGKQTSPAMASISG